MYLDDFKGAVISVSHDRYFLDRTCHRIFAFEENAKVLEHTGNYSDYAAFKREKMQTQDNSQKKMVKNNTLSQSEETSKLETTEPPKKLKFSYNEQREFDRIEDEIEKLETQLSTIDEEMVTITSDFTRLNELSIKKEEIEEVLLEKMERFEYLSDLSDQIQAQKKK